MSVSLRPPHPHELYRHLTQDPLSSEHAAAECHYPTKATVVESLVSVSSVTAMKIDSPSLGTRYACNPLPYLPKYVASQPIVHLLAARASAIGNVLEQIYCLARCLELWCAPGRQRQGGGLWHDYNTLYSDTWPVFRIASASRRSRAVQSKGDR